MPLERNPAAIFPGPTGPPPGTFEFIWSTDRGFIPPLAGDAIRPYEDEDESEVVWNEDAPYEDEDESETSTDDLGESVPSMLIPGHPKRPARMVSCEQEIASGSEWLIPRLYQNELSPYGSIVPYHCTEFHDKLCTVEEDSSVHAEVIYSKMRLDKPEIAERFTRALGIFKEGMSQKALSLSSKCGFHIHVGVGNDGRNKCYSMNAIESLYHLGNFMEDFLFRIGSANWPWHRSESDYARNYGWDYASPVPKGLKGKPNIGSVMQNYNHSAMSFSHFFQSRDYCRCGAFLFSDWSECTCTNLRKPTIEFRVFNGTANPLKIRAYIALCLGMVGFAEQNSCEGLPSYGWRGTKNLIQVTSREVLDWVMENLYLTEEERLDILYCVEKSSLRAVL